MENKIELEQEWISKFDLKTGRLKEQLSPKCYEWAKVNHIRTEEIENELIIEKIKKVYLHTINMINYYMDVDESVAKIISLWNIGTYCYKEFPTYPILYLNAIRGAGKSRIENFISKTAWNGLLLNSVTDSILFRNAGKHTLILDEVESIMKKEKQTLRELLNSAYKKGATVQRMKKVKSKEGESFQIERFDLYCPIVIANITGMNEVTGDRCIPIVLEKSINPAKVKLIEDFASNPNIAVIKEQLDVVQCSLCSLLTKKNMINNWNEYISMKYNNYTTTLYTYTTLSTLSTLSNEEIELFDKINNLNITGRNLELFFPIIILASLIDKDILNELLDIVNNYTQQKIRFEMVDSPDIALYKFVSTRNPIEWYKITEMLNEFRNFFDSEGASDREWLNNHWFGRGLRRLKLMSQSRRTAKGIEVILDVAKAKEKTYMFESMEDKK